jgi:peptidoglycan-associated lipoprotein
MRVRCTFPALLPVLILAALLAVVGCAKRPAMTQASAPAPTGVSQAAPPPVAPPPAPAQQAPAPAPAAPASVVSAPAPPPPPKDFADVAGLREIHFDFDKSNIRPDAARTLDANAEWLRANTTMLVLIEGHCDERGTNEYNLVLGERRAKATMNYLVSRGIASDRFTLVSYGEERPVCTDHNEACWAKNRRAHFKAKER